MVNVAGGNVLCTHQLESKTFGKDIVGIEMHVLVVDVFKHKPPV